MKPQYDYSRYAYDRKSPPPKHVKLRILVVAFGVGAVAALCCYLFFPTTQNISVFEARYYAAELKKFDTLRDAEAFASQIKTRTAAGFLVRCGTEYRVLGGVYLCRADCTAVVEKNRGTEFDACLYEIVTPSGQITCEGGYDVRSLRNAVTRMQSLPQELYRQTAEFAATGDASVVARELHATAKQFQWDVPADVPSKDVPMWEHWQAGCQRLAERLGTVAQNPTLSELRHLNLECIFLFRALCSETKGA